MPEIVGDSVDRLVTVEAKNRAFPHGIMGPLHAAARKAAGDRAVTMAAAQAIVDHVSARDTVLILTGAGYPPTMPKGESDGPPGAAALARMIHRGIGAVPVFVCERNHRDPIVASSEASGLAIREFDDARSSGLAAAMVFVPSSAGEIEDWAQGIIDTLKPKVLISTERLGPGKDGYLHNALGRPISGPEAINVGAIDISPLVDKVRRSGVFTIGVGDFGNEIGFGRIYDAVVRHVPRGEDLATTVETDIIVPAMISNWGCYGIEACLAFLLKRGDLLRTPQMEERTLRRCLDAGGVEAMFCTNDFFVDGLRGEASMAIVELLGSIVSKNLEPVIEGPGH